MGPISIIAMKKIWLKIKMWYNIVIKKQKDSDDHFVY